MWYKEREARWAFCGRRGSSTAAYLATFCAGGQPGDRDDGARREVVELEERRDVFLRAQTAFERECNKRFE